MPAPSVTGAGHYECPLRRSLQELRKLRWYRVIYALWIVRGYFVVQKHRKMPCAVSGGTAVKLQRVGRDARKNFTRTQFARGS